MQRSPAFLPLPNHSPIPTGPRAFSSSRPSLKLRTSSTEFSLLCSIDPGPCPEYLASLALERSFSGVDQTANLASAGPPLSWETVRWINGNAIVSCDQAAFPIIKLQVAQQRTKGVENILGLDLKHTQTDSAAQHDIALHLSPIAADIETPPSQIYRAPRPQVTTNSRCG